MSERMKTETIQETIQRLERYVQRFERRYEIKSEDMIALIESGRYRETAEIGQWLTTYRRLKDFRGLLSSGTTRGTRSMAI